MKYYPNLVPAITVISQLIPLDNLGMPWSLEFAQNVAALRKLAKFSDIMNLDFSGFRGALAVIPIVQASYQQAGVSTPQ